MKKSKIARKGNSPLAGHSTGNPGNSGKAKPMGNIFYISDFRYSKKIEERNAEVYIPEMTWENLIAQEDGHGYQLIAS